MSTAAVIQLIATLVLAVFGSAAFWSYLQNRKTSSAAGTVAKATVEIQIEASRVANLEQRFGFAQRAWDDERASLHRQVDRLEAELEEERAERLADLDAWRAERAELGRQLEACRAEIRELRGA